jgi:HK97 gp10 family phage protein
MELAITGLPEVLRKLRAMPDALQQNCIRGAVSAAAVVIRDEATLRAPEYSGAVGRNHPPAGTLKRAIFRARLTSECTRNVEKWLVSVRRGKGARNLKAGNLDAYYATWVEYGTQKMGARPFMRPAFETKKLEAVEVMRDYIAERLPATVKGA